MFAQGIVAIRILARGIQRAGEGDSQFCVLVWIHRH